MVHRQLSAIRGAVLLAENELGHLTLPLIRPACEERIWLTYLLSLEPEDQNLLISLMVRLEGALMVEAQQKYFGSKMMKRLGFSKQFVTGQTANRAEAEEKLAGLGERLGWKAEPGELPTTGWLASTTGLSQLYEFVYSATSKGVHFSPSEQFRSGWTGSDPADRVRFLADSYTAYRADFGLYWLSVLFAETLATVLKHGLLEDSMFADDIAAQELRSIVATIRSRSPVPIALASEFNRP